MTPAPASPGGAAAIATAGGVRIEPVGAIAGRLAAPGSKSMSIRYLVLASLAAGRSVLTNPLEADDTVAVRDAVTALGASVQATGEGLGSGRDWIVDGTGGVLRVPDAPVDCRMSGTTLRIISAVATHAGGPVTVTGHTALRKRPIGVLVDALRSLGAEITADNGYPPVRVGGGGFDGGRVEVDVTASSQFVSAILLAAPLARGVVDVQSTGTAAHAYIDLTVEALRTAGVDVADQGQGRPGWRVVPALPQAATFPIDHDASAACHLLAFAMATGGTVSVTNAGSTQQPDARLTDVFTAMGGVVHREGTVLTVTGPQDVQPIDVDLSSMPDQVTTVAALAALADGESHIFGVGVTRGHETDRLAALATELAKVGARVIEEPDGLRITGVGPRSGRGRGPGVVRLFTHQDHRLAMAFAAVGARLPGIVVDDPNCVHKTYPGFWRDVQALGVEVTVAN